MKHLTENGYIRRGAEGQLELTPEGYQIAEATLERHNFLTEFFTSIGVSREVAEEDACGMEHSISKESFDRFREWYSGMKNEGTVKEGH
jgi:Mn-dependent DtxR family transcriptional regulator